MKISLREKKIKNGKISLYIEYYKGHSKIPSGKIKHNREYEFLDLYLVEKPKSSIDRQKNKEIKIIADKILLKRQNDVLLGKFGLPSYKPGANFIKYYEKLMECRKDSNGNYGNWKSCLKHLKRYCENKEILFRDINSDFINGFKEYLNKSAYTSANQPLSQNSKNSYFNKLKACLREAYNEKLFPENPLIGIKGIKPGDPKREYLTFEELKKLSAEECKYPVLKKAFLFGCLTGLRWSDIQKLKWKEIQNTDYGMRIVFNQKKTKELQYLDISSQASTMIGENSGKPEDRVFVGLKYSSYMNFELKKWAFKAGIVKDITFHSSRHTFATLQLSHGTDIYTVSKLLGHKHLRTTEFYSKIIDERKREAVNKIPELGIQDV